MESETRETILVTGGAGYIGSHACKALSKAGFLPIAYDNLTTGHAYAVKWGPFVQGDLNDHTKLYETFQTYKPKAVLHFAADALAVESMHNPGKYYRNNVASSLSLFEAMRDHGVKYIVFSSTCSTYGNPQFTPITEMHPQAPISPYGRSKWMVEQILKDFESAHGFISVFLRYFNAAGADLETEIGENHDPETHLIPSVIQAALGIKKEITVYGTNFPTKDGSAVRDYVHVQDLADAHILALKWLFEKGKSEVFNLGSGVGSSVLEIISAVEQYCGKKLEVKLEQKREGEPATLTADSSKAMNLLNWNAQCSDLPLLIESAWKWQQFFLENTPIVKSTFKVEEKV